MAERAVAVVTDSTSDIPQELAAMHDITVIPLLVNAGDRTFADGDLTQAEFFELMASSSKLPTTSTPAVGAFDAAFRAALQTAPSVLAIHISEKLSGTIETSRQAAAAFGDKVRVFDSKNLSWGEGFQVLEAARAAAAGAGIDEVVRVAERTRERVRMIVGVDKLDNLAKGGRIGAVSAFLGGLLNLKVTFTVDSEGKFEPVARTRGTKAALEHTVEWVRTQMGERTRGAFCVMHAMSAGNAAWLKDRLESTFSVAEMHVVDVGVVISTHTGTGWGVAVVPLD
ncbi:MAG TPA: DegV family protein [Coriobacteriia bacterium]